MPNRPARTDSDRALCTLTQRDPLRPGCTSVSAAAQTVASAIPDRRSIAQTHVSLAIPCSDKNRRSRKKKKKRTTTKAISIIMFHIHTHTHSHTSTVRARPTLLSLSPHSRTLSLSLSVTRNSPQWLGERIGCARWMCARIEALIVRIKEKENSKKLHCRGGWFIGSGSGSGGGERAHHFAMKQSSNVLEISIDNRR